MAVSVSRATSADAPVLMGMIRELAEFEKMPEAVKDPMGRAGLELECYCFLREDAVRKSHKERRMAALST
ncbi:hypothetical protein ANCDUO_11007 [Ancylostoma duodenale]|uniref:Uncharacterized protein n=1 Tax=Ancylostoma duodenale TaxID=51022 RepID=A0A0C2GIT1_9BILA|nr:hypothetical protein ANCDUO_11007 [Ancylostoma duodenale]